MAPLGLALTHKFTLNAWGVAGIFGGEEAISAVTLIPLYQHRRWLGWYNAPGSLDVARHFGNLVRSHFWERIFHHTTKSPAIPFGFDGGMGPRYTGALSGTEMQTGHLGYLAVDRCKEIMEEARIDGRETTPAHVALIDVGNVDYDQNVPRLSGLNAYLALIPITVNVVTCVMCALAYDWYSFSVILVGILAGGLASIALGSGQLILQSINKPAKGVPLGDGVLVPVIWEDIVVVVKGTEHTVNVITKGRFKLMLGDGLWGHAIGICSLVLILEFLVQLLLIPEGTLFGQVMFVISLCVSWVYNYAVSSTRKEKLQGDILFKKLNDPPIRKFYLLTRTAMTAFVALLVFHGVPNPYVIDVQKLLRTFLPNDTAVWRRWTERVARQVCDKSLSCLELDEKGEDRDLTEAEKTLLRTLLDDASAAYNGYLAHFPQGQKA